MLRGRKNGRFHNAILDAIPRGVFARDPRQVAPELLGKLLIRREGSRSLVARITETEAYLGLDDAAAHAAVGRTARNDVLFGPPGHAYVYFIYGNHYCLNVSCEPEGQAGCVLVRAVEPVSGVEEMARLRGIALDGRKKLRELTAGPGRLAEALGITRARDNGKDLLDAESDLQLADDGYHPVEISVTRRIGITKAADEPLRFFITNSEFVSGTKRQNLHAAYV